MQVKGSGCDRILDVVQVLKSSCPLSFNKFTIALFGSLFYYNIIPPTQVQYYYISSHSSINYFLEPHHDD